MGSGTPYDGAMVRKAANLGVKLKLYALFTGIMVLLSACAFPGPAKPVGDDTPNLEAANPIVASDLLSIFTQITIPFSTTIQVSSLDENSMVKAAVKGLVDQGYGIQRVTTDQGANLLRVIRTQPTDDKSMYRYTLKVGNVVVSRLYDISNRGALPASVFEISGSLIAADIDDSHFTENYNPQFKAVTYTSISTESERPTAISLITDDLVDRVSSAATQGASTQAINSSQVEITNLFNGESVFQSITDTHNQMARQVLVFPNDSMVMGDTNKLLVRDFLISYKTGSDQIRLVGCSNGSTNLAIGNEGLALGRAARVADELQRRGVPRDRILDEGCWAPVSAGDRFPGRGVVMELWRRKL